MLEPHRPIYSQGNPEFRGRLANHGACQGNLGIHPLASVYHAPCRRSAGRPLRRHQATAPGGSGLLLPAIRQEIASEPCTASGRPGMGGHVVPVVRSRSGVYKPPCRVSPAPERTSR
jgi:hypothetical protein